MKRLAHPFAVLFAVPLMLAAALVADQIVFGPPENSSVAKELEVDLELGIDDVSFAVNGEEFPPEALGPMGDQKLLVHLLMGVTDKYVKSKDGRPIDLLRTFETVKLEAQFGDESQEDGDEGDFEGKTVRFQWNEDEQAYDKSWHESDGDVAKLENLVDDMDVRVLLPAKQVSDGDTWDVPANLLLPLFMPGGAGSDDDEGDDEQSAAIEDELRSQLASFLEDFKVTCKYHGQRDEGDVRVAEIRFTFEGAPKLDLAPVIERIASMQEGAPEFEVVATLAARFKGEGTLLWNQAAGHMHTFDMQSDVGLSADIDADAEEDGESFQLAVTAEASGKATWKMAAKAP